MNSSMNSMTLFLDNLMLQADPRVKHYFMMGSVWPSILVTLMYVYVVVSAGPRLMHNRKPYELRAFMVAYNFCMVALSGYMVFEFCITGWFAGYQYHCQPVDYSYSPQAIRMTNVCWWFYFSKFIEFLDTIFFVLRKKTSQVTFLHVFHHAAMPCSIWWGVKFAPGGSGTFFGLLNSIVHFVMYTYYGLAAIGPHMQKYLWWKKYMTKLQMVQFVMICSHAVCVLFNDCAYPSIFIFAVFAYGAIFLVLFADFYIKAYQKPKVPVQHVNGNANKHTSNNNNMKSEKAVKLKSKIL